MNPQSNGPSILTIVALFVVLSMVCCCVGSGAVRDSQTLLVGRHRGFESIQQAVDAARDGDTLRIDAGIYQENIVVDKSLRLIGAGPSKTILQGFYTTDRRRDNVITIKRGTDTYLRGLTVRDGYEGLLVGPGSSAHMEQCLITRNYHYGVGFFRYDFNSFLYMRDCDVVGNGDGVNLNSTQAVILSSRFRDNEDDGLDLDGDASVLVYDCDFLKCGDDGIEIRLETKTHALVLGCRFEGNGEDGIEIINSRINGSDDLNDTIYHNILGVQNSMFRANARFGVGFVSQDTEQDTEAFSKTVLYAANIRFAESGLADVSSDYASVFGATENYPQTIGVTLTRGAKTIDTSLPVKVPLLVGIYDLLPNADGYASGSSDVQLDCEGLALHGNRLFVVDDDGFHGIYVLDRRTMQVVTAIPSNPFPGAGPTSGVPGAPGPEGLDSASIGDQTVLMVSEDVGRALFTLSLDPASYGHVLDVASFASVGNGEGVEVFDDRYLLGNAEGLHEVDRQTHKRIGDAVKLTFEHSFGGRVTGIGSNETDERLFATILPDAFPKKRTHDTAFIEVSPELDQVLGFYHLGPFSGDCRGILMADGLIYLVDGRSPFVDIETGEKNRNGQKVFVFMLEDDAKLLDRSVALLPLRWDGPLLATEPRNGSR